MIDQQGRGNAHIVKPGAMFGACDSRTGLRNGAPGAMLTRAAGAWVLIGLPVIAARLWWSVPAALTIFVVGVTVYVAAALRYMRRRRQPQA